MIKNLLAVTGALVLITCAYPLVLGFLAWMTWK